MRRIQLLAAACLGALCVDSMANEISLADNEQWRSLLHFDRDDPFEAPHSAVIDSDFFLAPNGASDPAAELAATLKAFRTNPDGIKPGTHALCRFPARALWITRMTEEKWFQNAACPDLEAWQERYNGASVGLIFASGYLGNPASFFWAPDDSLAALCRTGRSSWRNSIARYQPQFRCGRTRNGRAGQVHGQGTAGRL